MQNLSTTQARFEQEMRISGLRLTTTRQQIFDSLSVSRSPLSIQEIVSKVNGAHFVSVYRSINALYKAEIIRQVPRGFKSLFELSDRFQEHHHHATCEKCGTSKQVHSDQLESIIIQMAEEKGLKPTGHHIEIFGICNGCQRKNDATSRIGL